MTIAESISFGMIMSSAIICITLVIISVIKH